MGKRPFEIGLDETPGAHILGLLLAPDHLRIGKTGKFGSQRLGREWIKLFDAKQIDIVDPSLFPLLEEVVIDFAGAQDDATDLVVRHQHASRASVSASSRRMRWKLVPSGQFGKIGFAAPMAQKAFGSHQDQWLAEIALQLPAQDMEVIRRRRAIGDLPIVFGAALQIALQARGGVLGTLPVIAMRQAGKRGPTCAATCARPRR